MINGPDNSGNHRGKQQNRSETHDLLECEHAHAGNENTGQANSSQTWTGWRLSAFSRHPKAHLPAATQKTCHDDSSRNRQCPPADGFPIHVACPSICSIQCILPGQPRTVCWRETNARQRHESPNLFVVHLQDGQECFCGISTLPTCFIRFLPAFCFSKSLRLRVMSPP